MQIFKERGTPFLLTKSFDSDSVDPLLSILGVCSGDPLGTRHQPTCTH